MSVRWDLPKLLPLLAAHPNVVDLTKTRTDPMTMNRKLHLPDPNYPDLTPGAVVHHAKYGTGQVMDDWQFGQLLVRFKDGHTVYCNPARLSTDD
jgi:hypothetical protein